VFSQHWAETGKLNKDGTNSYPQLRVYGTTWYPTPKRRARACGDHEPMTPSSKIPSGAGLATGVRHWALARFLVYAATLVALMIGSVILGKMLIPPEPSSWHHPLALIRLLLTAVAMLALYVGLVRWMERRWASELEGRTGGPLFGIGLLAGAGLMAIAYLVLGIVGVATFRPGGGLAGLEGALATTFGAAVFEELLFRGVLFRILEEVAGTAVALAASALVFGALHGINPGATLLSTGAIAVESGLLLALAYAAVRNLWLPIGLHFAWNFTEGSVFGAKVSGTAERFSLIKSDLSGAPLLTGGGFGPEGSVVSMGVCLALSLVLVFVVIGRREWRPLTWRPSLP
jgi:uncharacterized protein